MKPISKAAIFLFSVVLSSTGFSISYETSQSTKLLKLERLERIAAMSAGQEVAYGCEHTLFSGTPIQVIERTNLESYVKVLDGKCKDQKGWIVNPAIKTK